MKTWTAILLAVLAATPAFSQETDDIDRAAIEEAVRAAEDEAAAFAVGVAARAEAYAEEARALTDSVNARLQVMGARPDGGPIDLGAMLAQAPQIAEARDAPPPAAGVLVFASFAMPEESLRRLVVEARAASVPVMLRGFIGGSLTETAARMRDLLGEMDGSHAEAEFLGGVVIDPRAFRVFEVTDAPAFIATASPLPDCDGLDCSAPPPPHDRIAGNMSLGAALSALASEGEDAPLHARAALARLEDGP